MRIWKSGVGATLTMIGLGIGLAGVLAGARPVAMAAQAPPTSTAATSAAEVERLRRQLVGSYRLVYYRTYDQAGKETVLPYRSGQISYDGAGRMSAQLVRDGQQRFAGPQPTEAERAAAYSSFISYFGAYDIDAVKRSVTHHVEGANNPGMVGNHLTRYFEFSADGRSLFLAVKDGERVTGRLQWDRF